MTIEGRCWRFTHAVSRQPGKSIVDGLRATEGQDPDYRSFLDEHGAYTKALEQSGGLLTILDPLEAFPDSVFVEDAALCVSGQAIILRPGAESRFGEAEAIQPALQELFGSVLNIKSGYVDGGDILLSDDEALIGLSDRTNEKGVGELEKILTPLGYSVKIVHTPKGVLHFKTDCGLLDSNTIFSTRLLAASGCFDKYRVIEAPEGEEAAANLIRYNEFVFLRSGFPKTKALLESEGYRVKILSVNQAALVDGGLSCMSLRFSL